MKVRLVGSITEAELRLPCRFAGGRLVLDRGGRQRMTLDSGFTGSLAIPEEWANRLDLRYAGIQPFELANRQIVEFPTYLGWVRLGRGEALFEFLVTGEALLGMEFFEVLEAQIVIDCKARKVVVEGEVS